MGRTSPFGWSFKLFVLVAAVGAVVTLLTGFYVQGRIQFLTATLRLASVASVKAPLLISPASTPERVLLKERRAVEDELLNLAKGPGRPWLRILSSAGDYITVTARGVTTTDLEPRFKEILESTVADQNQLLATALAKKKQETERLTSQLDQLEGQTNKLSRDSSSWNTLLGFVLRVGELKERVSRAQSEIDELSSSPSAVTYLGKITDVPLRRVFFASGFFVSALFATLGMIFICFVQALVTTSREV